MLVSKDIRSRVCQLHKDGKTGEQIARILRNEGVAIKDAEGAFYNEGYVVRIEGNMLHVSNGPMDGLAVLFATSAPLALPYVVWGRNTGT